jgi:phosphoglycolate phosphatase-like HAD superfamily hydrolase
MLILFDIDGTLLLTQRAGTLSMQAAARELFGDQFTFDAIELGGWLDPLIWDAVARANGIEDPASHHDRFRATYLRHFQDRLARNPTVTALPGVTELIEALSQETDTCLGLLTGNYPETGRMKIEAAGLDLDSFAVSVWGVDGAHRRELPVVAMAQYATHTGRTIAPHDVVIIGDTVHDIDCAKANGCRSLAVATGVGTADELAAREPDLLVGDLSDTSSILAWLLKPVETVSD